eukprot:m.65615 g.65615  ORF g.65615 m.65615 type:complete len:85 (+) comp13677_c0_seq2:1785-2039(+)
MHTLREFPKRDLGSLIAIASTTFGFFVSNTYFFSGDGACSVGGYGPGVPASTNIDVSVVEPTRVDLHKSFRWAWLWDRNVLLQD